MVVLGIAGIHESRRRFPVSRLLVCLVLAIAAAASSSAIEKPEVFESKILAELQQQNPAAVSLFQKANEARTARDHGQAAELYGKVQELAPRFDHAIRRRSGEELSLGNRSAAIQYAREALNIQRSAPNLAALSVALSSPTKSVAAAPGVQQEFDQAVDLAEEAVKLDPDDPYVCLALSQAAMRAGNIDALRIAVDRLRVIAPEEVATHTLLSMLAWNEQRIDEARMELRRARELGMPEQEYRSIDSRILASRPLLVRALPAIGGVAGAWLAGFAILIGAGWILSRATLSAVDRITAQTPGSAGGADALLRRLYRFVLWLSGLFYYVSLPLLLTLVLLTGGILIYGLLMLRFVALKLVAIIAILTLTTALAILRSLFVRVKDVDPGLKLPLEENPRLQAVLNAVAERLGTPPVSGVYIQPGTTIAVMERGGLTRRWKGVRERCLILGAGVLEGMSLGSFRAILAHEFGHLSHQDTAGGDFALTVRRSLLTMAATLARDGAAKWYNPAWQFLKVFYKVFLRISQGASRLQEVLADRRAVSIYGAEAFEKGLRHVIERSVRFGAHATATVNQLAPAKKPLVNLYQFQPTGLAKEEEIEKAFQASLSRPASPYDSHPTPLDRFRWARNQPQVSNPTPEDESVEVWSLFQDRQGIEESMTTRFRADIWKEYSVEVMGPLGS